MSYHAIRPLIKFAKKNNLQVFDFDLVKAQGGSIRVYVSHLGRKKVNNIKIKSQIVLENNKGLFSERLYDNYMKRINNQKNILSKILKSLKKQKKKIVGFGAPAKLTTFSYKFNINNKIVPFVVDDNYLKQNRYSPGKNIKIISYKNLKTKRFDAIIIFAWNFAQSIITRINKDFKDKLIIVPFPKVKIIKK